MNEEDKIRIYKDRIRIFLILYFFSDDYNNPDTPDVRKLFKSEIRLQKIDFLLRNPDYLAHELINIAKDNKQYSIEIKEIVKDIFVNKEPLIRRLEMERFFFGAYEDIDDVIAFLQSIGFVKFSSKRSSDLKTIEKHYYITSLGQTKFENSITSFSYISWYINRCKIIKKFFGDLSGNELKALQYQVEVYRDTSYKDHIASIQETVLEEFADLFNEKI